MQRLQEYHSQELVERALGVVEVRLKSREHLRPLAAEVAEQRAELSAAASVASNATEARVAATGEVGWRDDVLDRAVMNLSRAVLATIDGDRKHPRYQKLFPVAPSKAMRGTANTSQTRFVRAILDVHGSDGSYAEFDDQVEAIQAAADAVEAALAARDTRYSEEAQALRNLASTKAQVSRFYNQLHPRLLLIEDDRALVESFFYSFGDPGS